MNNEEERPIRNIDRRYLYHYAETVAVWRSFANLERETRGIDPQRVLPALLGNYQANAASLTLELVRLEREQLEIESAYRMFEELPPRAPIVALRRAQPFPESLLRPQGEAPGEPMGAILEAGKLKAKIYRRLDMD